MIPLGQLITPITPVTPASGQMGAAIGDAGEMAANIAERNRQFSQKQLEDYQKWINEAADRDVKQKHFDQINAYYNAQTALHKDQLQEKTDLANEKTLRQLQDEFRRAKSPQERDLVRQKFQSAGFNIGETDTALPEEAPGPEATAAPEKMGVAEGGYANPPKPNAKFRAQLDAFMASPAAQATSAEPETAMGTAELPPEMQKNPYGQSELEPWDLLGFGAPKIKPPEKPSRGGKFTVTDKSGKTVLEWDEPLAQKHMADAILEHAAPLIEGARTPENSAAATRAARLVAGMADPSWSGKDTLDAFMKAYQAETGQFKKAPVGGGGGGHAGPSKTDIKLAERDDTLVNHVISRVGGQYEMKEIDKSITMAKNALGSMNEQTGMGDLNAFKQYLLAMSGKVVTDKEMGQFMNSTGAWNSWEKKYNEYMNAGRFPPEFLRQLQGLMQHFVDISEAKRKELGDNAYRQVIGLQGSKDAANVARGHFTGQFEDTDVAPLGAPKPKSPTTSSKSAPTMGGPSGRARAEEWLKRQQGGQ